MLRWQWGRPDELTTVYFVFVWVVGGAMFTTMSRLFGPLRHDNNPLWTTTRIEWFAVAVLPLALCILVLAALALRWVWRNPPVKVVTRYEHKGIRRR